MHHEAAAAVVAGVHLLGERREVGVVDGDHRDVAGRREHAELRAVPRDDGAGGRQGVGADRDVALRGRGRAGHARVAGLGGRRGEEERRGGEQGEHGAHGAQCRGPARSTIGECEPATWRIGEPAAGAGWQLARSAAIGVVSAHYDLAHPFCHGFHARRRPRRRPRRRRRRPQPAHGPGAAGRHDPAGGR